MPAYQYGVRGIPSISLQTTPHLVSLLVVQTIFTSPLWRGFMCIYVDGLTTARLAIKNKIWSGNNL